MTDRYDYWNDALEGRENLMISQNHPMPGFYRTKRGEPVAIWDNEDGTTSLLVSGFSAIAPEDQEDWWTRCCTRPVTEEAYQAVVDGGVWPDVDEVIAETMGDNIKDATDPEGIKILIDMLKGGADKYTEINDVEVEAKAQSLRSRALELKSRADKLREAEKAPHLKASREVDTTWMPLVKAAEDVANSIRKRMEVFRTKLVVAENKRKAEEAAAAAKLQEQNRSGTEPMGGMVDSPIPAEQPGPMKTKVTSGYGRAASVRTKVVVTGIESWEDACRSYFQRPELYELLLKMAQRDLEAGLAINENAFRTEEQAIVR